MRDDLHPDHHRIWKSGIFTGVNRPVARVTVQRPLMKLRTFQMRSTYIRTPLVTDDVASFNPYPSGINPNKGQRVTNTYADYLFSAPTAPRELLNVRKVSWLRSTDADVAEATLEFWNVAPKDSGFDRGAYSWNRGGSLFSKRWNHEPDALSGLLVPDNIIRTYEGYGSDLLHNPALTLEQCPPERDSRLALTGTWIIDSVDLNAFGIISVKARDVGRLLLDHQVFTPVIPEDFYPPSFEDWDESVKVQSKRKFDTRRTKRGYLDVSLAGASTDFWPESNYFGHKLAHAMDRKGGTYWMSTGNPKPTYRSAIEYVDIKVKKQHVISVELTTKKTGYRVYISLKRGGGWVGGKTMPYHRDGRGRYEEGVPYVKAQNLGNEEGPHQIVLNGGEGYDDVTLIRVWLGNLPDFGLGWPAYRAGIREVRVKGQWVTGRKGTKVVSKAKALKPGPAGSNPGRVEDLTDIVKLFCAWAGLYWPRTGYVLDSDGRRRALRPAKSDKEVLGAKADGRVWGDFQETGTSPLVEMTAGNFDKKTLMDAIAVVRDMTGFLFMVDEAGAVQWRLPNIWTRGNWITGLSANPRRVSTVHVIDENQTLLDAGVTIQSRNVREAIFVANPVGKYGAMVGGYNPNPTGLRRVAGWTDQDFASREEAQIMADLIAVRQAFRYRADRVQITANPAIQVDDQVRIYEEVTSEGFIHYVKGVSSELDVATGKWTYTLETHWLGDNPEGAWVVGRNTLHESTVSYVDALSSGPQWSRKGGI